MIEKMKFLSITGPKDDIDRVMDVYLSKYEVHLENALIELNNLPNLKPFVEINPYKDTLNKAEALIGKIDDNTMPSARRMTAAEATDIITNAYDSVDGITTQKKELKNEKKKISEIKEQLEPFRQLDYELNKILEFKFIKFRFGKITHEHYKKFSNYVYDNLNTVFLECNSDKDYIWGIYFVPDSSAERVDAIFTSLHFQRIRVPGGFQGTPEEVCQSLQNEINEIQTKRDSMTNQINTNLREVAGDLKLAYETLSHFSENFDIRKLAACTIDHKKSEGSFSVVFYILCGWMSKKDAKAFLLEIENDPNLYCISEDVQENVNSKPPTKLKNPKFFKPFEMFIHMYGLPAYNEMDPTIFIALTYTLMFGIMFGDVGQGLCLTIGGFLLYHFKKMNIAAIISTAGVWSTFFGFMYGSVFGFEEILQPVWRRPMSNIMSTLITAVAFGVVLILIAMVLNIINGIRAKNIEKIFFDPSGIAGLLCYGSVVVIVLLMVTGHKLPATIILVCIVGIPLLAIFLKEPLTHLVQRKSSIFPPGSKAMFFVEALVEVFDVVLSYATNTISFVRVGAFALSHAGMMGVVLSLAGATSGHPNLLIIILGNIAVTGLEGLVVGIQVLRLEYYEMFSRFYSGTGKEFKPFKAKSKI